MAKGDYIGFVDSDDIVLPKMYENLYCEAIECNADAVWGQMARIEEKFSLDGKILNENLFENCVTITNEIKNLDGKLLNDSNRAVLIAHPSGGVCSGIWKRNIIIRENIMFPEKLRYEDNFWCTLFYCYIERFKLSNKIGYLYRRNSNSTVLKRNEKYQYDRIIIEKMLREEAVRRDLFVRYIVAWEAIYIFRYVFNSIATFSRKFDVIDEDIIRKLICDLKDEYPEWYKNKLWRAMKSNTAYIRCRFIAEYTDMYIYMVKIKLLIKRLIR